MIDPTYKISETLEREEKRIFDVEDFIQEVLIWMDFERIFSTMHHLNWKWGGSKNPPTIQEIKKSCVKAIKTTYKEMIDRKLVKNHYSSGGWDVVMWRDDADDTDIIADVKFVLTEWDNYL